MKPMSPAKKAGLKAQYEYQCKEAVENIMGFLAVKYSEDDNDQSKQLAWLELELASMNGELDIARRADKRLKLLQEEKP